MVRLTYKVMESTTQCGMTPSCCPDDVPNSGGHEVDPLILQSMPEDDPLLVQSMPEDDPNGNVNTEMGRATERWGPRHVGAQRLASMYSREKYIQETICVVITGSLMVIILMCLLFRAHWSYVPTLLLGAVGGAITCDFLSGLVHWASDTWGTVDMFIVGRAFIRPFREHHVDPTAITRHNFIEVNGDAFALCLLPLANVLYQHLTLSNEQLVCLSPSHSFLFMLAFYACVTNQIHKWSHMYFGLPKWVNTLQRYHLILPRGHHKVHHVAPHAKRYCITTGWLNAPLDSLGFWRHLERMVTSVTGCYPRTDDMKWALTTERASPAVFAAVNNKIYSQ